MSNTKLTTEQKQMRKNLRKSFGPQCEMVTVGRVTLFRQPEFSGSNMGLLSIAVASVKEQKFRRKVGEYLALERAAYGEYIKVPMCVSLKNIGIVLSGEYIADDNDAYAEGFDDGYEQGVTDNSLD